MATLENFKKNLDNSLIFIYAIVTGNVVNKQ